MSNVGTGGISPLRDPANGVRAPQPPDLFINRQRRPSALGRDYANFDLGALWLYWPSSSPNIQEVWQLVSLQQVNNAPFGKWVLVTGGNGTLVSLTGDSGGPVFSDGAGNINVLTGPAAGNTVNNLVDVGTPGTNTITWSLNNSISQPNTNSSGTAGMYSLGLGRFMHNYGTNNTFLGFNAGNLTLTVASAVSNTALGYQNGMSLTTGSDNTLVGWATGSLITTGQYNNCVSAGGMASLTTGSYNTGLGHQVFSAVGAGLVSGSFNIAVGADSGSDYIAGESSNILLNNLGTPGESNTLHIGQSTGTGLQQLNAAYVQGIYNKDVGATNLPVIIDNTGKLGTGTGGVPFYSTNTFVPLLFFGGGSTGITYNNALTGGKYTQIGNIVIFDLTITLTSKGVSVGTATVGGLPFAAAAFTTPRMDVQFQYGTGLTYTGTTLWGEFNAIVAGQININQNSSGLSASRLDDTNFSNTTTFTLTGFYYTA